MRKIKILIVLSILIMSFMLLTGCANDVLYRTWQLKETINANTNEASDAGMFSNMMVFKINKDGTVLLLDSQFGTYEKKGSEFVFTYDVDEGEEPRYESGAWEIIGSDLYIYDDNAPAIYHFVAVSKLDNNEN